MILADASSCSQDLIIPTVFLLLGALLAGVISYVIARTVSPLARLELRLRRARWVGSDLETRKGIYRIETRIKNSGARALGQDDFTRNGKPTVRLASKPDGSLLDASIVRIPSTISSLGFKPTLHVRSMESQRRVRLKLGIVPRRSWFDVDFLVQRHDLTLPNLELRASYRDGPAVTRVVPASRRVGALLGAGLLLLAIQGLAVVGGMFFHLRITRAYVNWVIAALVLVYFLMGAIWYYTMRAREFNMNLEYYEAQRRLPFIRRCLFRAKVFVTTLWRALEDVP